MNEHDTTTRTGEDEQLVAYLDGELAPQEAAEVERRLSEEPPFRERLRQLQQAWDLLDTLPRSTVSEAFTRSTVEMAAVSASQEVARLERRDRRRRLLWWAGVGAAVAVAAAAGYAAAWRAATAGDRRLARDLPVIENVDLYRQAGSIEFLRLLDQEGVFADEAAAGERDDASS